MRINRNLALVAGLVATIVSIQSVHAAIVLNPSFESPTAPVSPGYVYEFGGGSGNPDPFTIDNWIYGGGIAAAGLARYGSAAFDSYNRPFSGSGSQFAFVQVQGAYVAQDLSLTAGGYTLSFWVAPRSGTVAQGTADYQVLLNATPLISGSTVGGNNPFTQVTTSFSVASAGTYTLKFLNTTAVVADNTFLLDNVLVELAPIPEPSVVALFSIGGLLAWRRVRRG